MTISINFIAIDSNNYLSYNLTSHTALYVKIIQRKSLMIINDFMFHVAVIIMHR
jgi:hypothetical protein